MTPLQGSGNTEEEERERSQELEGGEACCERSPAQAELQCFIEMWRNFRDHAPPQELGKAYGY